LVIMVLLPFGGGGGLQTDALLLLSFYTLIWCSGHCFNGCIHKGPQLSWNLLGDVFCSFLLGLALALLNRNPNIMFVIEKNNRSLDHTFFQLLAKPTLVTRCIGSSTSITIVV
jgi:hypothetical protein